MSEFPVTTLNGYQMAALSTWQRRKIMDVVPAYVYPALGLAGETGEVLEKVKKLVRDKNGLNTAFDRHGIALELGDVFWYLCVLADEFGYSLEEIASLNIEKITRRKEAGTIAGSGDDR